MDDKSTSVMDGMGQLELYFILDAIRKRRARDPQGPDYAKQYTDVIVEIGKHGIMEDIIDEWFSFWDGRFRSLTIDEVRELIGRLERRADYTDVLKDR